MSDSERRSRVEDEDESEKPRPSDPRPAGADPATNGTLLSRRPDTDPKDTGQQLSVGEG